MQTQWKENVTKNQNYLRRKQKRSFRKFGDTKNLRTQSLSIDMLETKIAEVEKELEQAREKAKNLQDELFLLKVEYNQLLEKLTS